MPFNLTFVCGILNCVNHYTYSANKHTKITKVYKIIYAYVPICHVSNFTLSICDNKPQNDFCINKPFMLQNCMN